MNVYRLNNPPYVFEEQWEKIRHCIPQWWPEMRDSEIEAVKGDRSRMSNLLKEHYGWNEEEAELQINYFLFKTVNQLGIVSTNVPHIHTVAQVSWEPIRR